MHAAWHGRIQVVYLKPLKLLLSSDCPHMFLLEFSSYVCNELVQKTYIFYNWLLYLLLSYTTKSTSLTRFEKTPVTVSQAYTIKESSSAIVVLALL